MDKQVIFVSYGHQTLENVVKKVVDDLRKEEVYEVFLDKDYLYQGDWETKIDNAIQRCSHFVFFVSKKSVSLEGYCLNELARAVEYKKTIVPIMLDDSYVPLSIVRLQRIMIKNAVAADNSIIEDVYESCYQRLLKIVRNEEEVGYFDTGFDISKEVQAIDAFEITHHTLNFVGRDSFFADVEKWINKPDSLPIYLLQAAPGIGKTAMCAMLTINFHNNVAGIHFCSFGNRTKTDARSIIKNLAAQIAGRNEDYNLEIKKILTREANIDNLDAKRLFELFFIEVGNKVTFKNPQIIVIDALDEAVLDNKNEIAEMIVTYQNTLPSWLKILCSTRPQKNVVSYFSSCHVFSMLENNEENVADIKKYYDQALSNYKFDAETLRILLGKTHGSFLYAKSIVSLIKSGEYFLDNVREFPDGIYSYYLIWFDRIFPKAPDDYEDIRKIISLLLATSVPPTVEFLADATGLSESEIRKNIDIVSNYFVIIEDGTLKSKHKSILDWLSESNECPAKYCVSRRDGYKILLEYIEKQIELGEWKNNPYVILDYQKALKALKKTEKLCKLLKNFEFLRVCIKSKLYTLYEGLFEYIDNINYIYKDDDYEAFEIYESDCFTKIFVKYRQAIYNAGLFIKLKEAGFGKFLKNRDPSDDVNYDMGVIQFHYISLSFTEAFNDIKEFIKEHDLGELDIEIRSEFERMAMLVYRKMVLFDELIGMSDGAIKDAKEAGDLYEESLINLTLSKVYCRKLDLENCYKAADNAVMLLDKRVKEEMEDGTQIGDHLFLAEDYRVYADACIWHMDLAKAKDKLNKAEAIYVLYNQHDRYYTRFLYTSMFYEIVNRGNEARIMELKEEAMKCAKENKDLYDQGQIYFLTSLYYLVNYNGDTSLLAKAEAPCSEAIEIAEKLNIPIELTEAQALYNLICEAQKVTRKYEYLQNESVLTWIKHVEKFIRDLKG